MTEPTCTPSLRIRRAAALRLAPFAESSTDPLDDVAGQQIGEPEQCHGAEYTPAGWRPCRCRAGAA